MKCTKCGDTVRYDYNKAYACPSCGEQYTLDQVMQSSPTTTGLQAGPKDSDPDATPPLILWDDKPASKYPTCIKCDAELCEALDRFPDDPPGELVRCARCKDSRKGSKDGWSW